MACRARSLRRTRVILKTSGWGFWMQIDRNQLRCYISAPVVRRFAADSRPPAQASADSMLAATLMADIAGFTALTNKLAVEGAVGSETLTVIINDYFSKLVSVVAACGGEVIAFAGDALVATWVAADEDGLREAVFAAACCAATIRSDLDNYDAGDGNRLSLRQGLGAGSLFGVHVGGVADKWFYVLAGEAMLQTVAAVLATDPGGIVASSQFAEIAGPRLHGTPTMDEMVKISDVEGSFEFNASEPTAIPDESWPALERYVPDQVLVGVAAGQGEWLAGSRVVSVMFVKLLDLAPGAATALETAQAAMVCMQQVFLQFDGYINQILIDDKGAVIVGVFGAPPQAHEDDALRSVEASLELRRALAGVGQRSSIGVTTGRAFAGPVGGMLRRSYTVMGDVMNLSARLMSAAGDGILCDQATVAAVGHRADFEAPVAMSVKGWSDKVATYVPISVDRGRARRRDGIGRLAGRKNEVATVERCLDAITAGDNRLLILEGEPGVGKSRLVADLLARAHARGFATMLADADAMQQATPYFAWRRCMSALVEMDHADGWTAEQRREHVLGRLDADDRSSGLAPLLSNVLPVEFPDTEVTRAMAGDDRSYSTRQLVTRLIRSELAAAAARDQRANPVVLVLEDAHWFDSASWDVAIELSGLLTSLLIVVATRPMESPSPGLLKLTEDKLVDAVRVEALSADETCEMICDRLGVDSIPSALASLVTERAEGNPFFSEELVLALRDAGVIEITDGSCRVARDDLDLRTISFPDTLHGVVTSRIDRLPPSEQLTIKVAAVIGRVFGYIMLNGIHPTNEDTDVLLAELEDLRRLDLTPLKEDQTDLAYLFKHIITQEVAYSLLPAAQRAQLHRVAAEWIEESSDGNYSKVSRDLAHHWSHAGDMERAAHFYDIAGRDALRQGAYHEAAESFASALKLATALQIPPSPDTIAEWHIRLGEAFDGLTDFDRSISHFEQALAVRGRQLPRSAPAWTWLVAKGVCGQAANLAFPKRRIGRRTPTPGDQDVAEICRRLSLVLYHRNEKLTTIATVILGLNVAEAIDSKKYRAEFCGNAAVVCGLIGIDRLGEHYLAVGTELAQHVNDPLTTTWIKQSVAWYSCGVGGNWDRARVQIGEALEMARGAGLRRIYDEELLVRAVSHWAEPFAVRAEMWAIANRSAAERGDTEVQIWARGIGAASVLADGRANEAIELLESAIPMFRRGSTRTGYVKVYGTLCFAYLRAGRRDEAVVAAHRAVQAVQEAAPILVSMFEGYANTVETCLALWEAGDTEWERPSRQALKSLRGLARPYKVARPRAKLFAGRVHMINGHRRRAARSWKKAHELALRLDIPYEAARANAEIGLLLRERGRHLEADAYLDQARIVFERCGAPFDLQRIAATKLAA